MKKLFLSLSILTIAFSAQAEFMPKNYFNNSGRMIKADMPNLQKGLVAVAPALVKSEALYRKSVSSAARLASNAKVAVVAAPAAVVAGSLYAFDYGQSLKGTETQLVVEKQSLIEQHIQNSIVQDIKNKNNIVSTNATVLSKAAHVKNALLNVGSSVKTQVLAHPRIATGAGLATIAGLSYVAYKNFGKATANKDVKTKKPEVKAVKAAQVVSQPKKAHKGLPGGYARRGYARRR